MKNSVHAFRPKTKILLLTLIFHGTTKLTQNLFDFVISSLIVLDYLLPFRLLHCQWRDISLTPL